ncbi:AMP-binding protein [Burkholderia sp. LMU1-1-1.1]|uniref:AMP-binding protein n=1 Tax=Burkholderia sp. LMU1-1-1.1 TaxID=3135266 RepID=UPI00341BAE9B
MHNLPDLFDHISGRFGAGVPVLSDGAHTLDGGALRRRVGELAAALLARRMPRAPVAILADNSPEWLAVDLATQQLGLTLVPLPLFFTPAQWGHVLADSGATALFCASAGQGAALGFGAAIACGGPLVLCEAAAGASAATPAAGFPDALAGTQKITFTSGTTSTPKGVCLSAGQQWQVARALRDGVAGLALERHLCLLPFAVLLENIAGPYTALLSGATTICPPLAETGMAGASRFDPLVCLAAIERHRPHSIIVLPQMLQALVAVTTAGDPRLASLRFVAVGGARTPPRLLAAARARGLPVFEGYGLSECASVVALNLPGAAREGSVGKPLAHRPVRIAADGEIEVGGDAAHYLGQAPGRPGDWLATGDLGHLDADGFLHIDGRKKDILITGFGRNVSPEWPETALLGTGAIGQAVVVGDGQPYLAALIVPLAAHIGAEQIAEAVARANLDLPDYAQVRRWALAAPFTPANGQATANGRPRRAVIHQHYAPRIAALYDTTETTA